MSKRSWILFITTLVLLPLAGESLAQTADVPDVRQLAQMLQEQQKLLDQQQKELERQRKEIAEQGSLLDAQKAAIAAVGTRVDEIAMLGGAAPAGMSPEEIALQDRLQRVEETLANPPDATQNLIKAGEFPGSFQVPGTNMALKAGGFVRLGLVDNFSDIGSDDRFIVGTIPPEGTGDAGDGRRITISAKRSRLNLDVRMDSSVGEFRAFVEGDFAGQGGSDNYRLRHAYGQYGDWVIGQTWSTFTDMRADPEELDFEGLNAQAIVRQPLARWGKGLGEDKSFAISLEDPAPEITGGEGVSVIPNLAANLVRHHEWGHLQASLVLRNIIGEIEDPNIVPGTEESAPERKSAFGYGLSVSGNLRTRRWDQRDSLKFELSYGRGIGRYLNDLDSVGGQDAVFSPEGELKALPAFGGWVAYQHFWKENAIGWLRNLRSTLVYGLVYVDNYDFQEEGSYHRTQRASLNMIWSPISSIDLGLEFLWGERLNNDDTRGRAGQFQGVATFRF